ncbi:MAG: alpha-glucosidase [Acholeplasma sp.]|jgi:oligo-1,6-glucosidase/glucan 1,6-alpha-glucosidase|nr:MAG: alpha-glucosidase [Acholeplasma sp.]
MGQAPWWKRAIVYQIYPLSFKDSNQDGLGDIPGIISRLDYLKRLGVDVIWLSPVYRSPMDDNGYDIADYYSIDPIFGTLDDMKRLLNEVHDRGMKLIMDLVVNHTSDEHIWFKESKKDVHSPYRDYYLWRQEPTQVDSIFGGSAWTLDPTTNMYYFHLFSKRQPDLNWHHKPLREAIYTMVNWWLDLGIDGFRMDVIDLIGKNIDQMKFADGPYLHTYLKELYERCFEGRDIMTVGEMPGLSIERAKEITHGEHPLLDMVFQFAHVGLDEVPGQGKWVLKKLDLLEFKHTFETLQKMMHDGGWNSLFLSNHDQPRVVSRYGSELYRKASAKMLATILYGMQGTPYIYQGEEIGMTGIQMPIKDYRDLETKQIYDILKQKGWDERDIMRSIYAKSRDNSRTPFQWNRKDYAGFSTHEPWLSVNPNYLSLNAEDDQNDPEGVFPYYQKLIQLRKTHPIFDEGDFMLIFKDHPLVFAYQRKYQEKTITVIGSFSDQPITLDLSSLNLKQIIQTNDETVTLSPLMTLSPYYTAIFS